MKFFDLLTGRKADKNDTLPKTPLIGAGVILNLDGAKVLSAPIPTKESAMVPRLTDTRRKITLPQFQCTGPELLWVSREQDETGAPLTTRVPEQRDRSTHILLPFRIGNLHYPHISCLFYRREPDSPCFVDIYGRKVFHYSERFPCFDSYDYLHDHRRFHWFFIRQEDRLIRLCYADSSNILHISTDVAVIEEKCWSAMTEAGFLA